nr:MAG TPA: hypothetical protein [Caudoviricetes sp.]
MLTNIGQIIALCIKMTNLKLEASCGFDRQFAMKWYENEYITGKHVRYVMKPNLTINSHEDGKVYRAFNCSDAKAVELMEKEPAYRDYFIDLEAPAVTIPELEEEDGGGVKPESGPEAEPEAAAPATELSDEEAAALKRSEAAKKAAATRAAKKAAAEAAEIAEFEG